VWEEADFTVSPAVEPERRPVGGDWVMVVPEVYEAQLSEALYGLPAMPTDYGHIPRLLIESEWSELSEVAWTDKDGYFDVDVEEGDYWVCMGYSGRPYDVVNCVLKYLGRGEAQFEWNMGNLY
jgi:hypothetical protein